MSDLLLSNIAGATGGVDMPDDAPIIELVLTIPNTAGGGILAEPGAPKPDATPGGGTILKP